MNASLPKIDHDIHDGQSEFIYAIAINPKWPHWKKSELPSPIKHLLAKSFPGVAIEQVSGWQGATKCLPEGSEEVIDPATLPHPVFRLGFSENEAQEFRCAWKKAWPELEGAAVDFYFVVIEAAKRHPACLSSEELQAAIERNDLDISCVVPGPQRFL